MPRHLAAAPASAALLALLAALPPGPARANWVSSWGAAPATLDVPGLRATTVRQILRLSVGGSQVRVRFSNEAGTMALTVADAHLALPGAAPGSVDPSTDRALTFGGRTAAAAPPGAPLLSDPVDMPVPALSTLVVTAFLDAASPRQPGHPVGGDTAYLVPGDHAGDAALAGATTSPSRYALSAVEVSTPGQAGAAVGTLGDSITDGVGATNGLDRRWTDRLAERLVGRVGGPAVGVVDGGISGNAVLDGGLVWQLGPSALARLDRDALARPGLRWLILFEGVNDILNAADPGAAASDLIAAYGAIVTRARDRGVRVIGATLTPFGGFAPLDTPARQRARQAVNAWIRTGGAFDAVLDFDAVLRDPSRPLRLRADYDSGDHLHPGDAGYRALGDAVPLGLFQ